MSCKRRRRCAPYYANNSHAERAHNARRECRLARKGARSIAGDDGAAANRLVAMTRFDASPNRKVRHAARAIARTLVQAGERCAHEQEQERKRAREFEVPYANTSWGQIVEEELVPSKREAAVSKLLRLAMKAGCDKAVELLSCGNVKAGIVELVKVTG